MFVIFIRFGGLFQCSYYLSGLEVFLVFMLFIWFGDYEAPPVGFLLQPAMQIETTKITARAKEGKFKYCYSGVGSKVLFHSGWSRRNEGLCVSVPVRTKICCCQPEIVHHKGQSTILKYQSITLSVYHSYPQCRSVALLPI